MSLLTTNKRTRPRPPLGATSMMFWDRTVEAAVAPLADMGYDAIEIWAEHLWRGHEDPARVAQALAAHRLRCTVHCPILDVNLTSLNQGIREESLRQTLHSVELAHDLCADLLVVHPGHLSSSRDALTSHWQMEYAALDKIADHGERLGVHLAIENMDTPARLEVVKTAEDIRRIVDHYAPGQWGVVLDTTHLGNAARIVAFVEAGLNITHVHLSDTEALANGAVRTHLPLGEGNTDFAPVFAALLPHFQGILSLETFIPAGTLDKIRAQKAWLDQALA
jgi:sugar phosphate isomerase/epimerase